MKTNLGMGDRVVRILIAVITVVLYFAGFTSGMFGIGLMIAGGVLFLTSLAGFCPLYFIFGIRSNKNKTHGA